MRNGELEQSVDLGRFEIDKEKIDQIKKESIVRINGLPQLVTDINFKGGRDKCFNFTTLGEDKGIISWAHYSIRKADSDYYLEKVGAVSFDGCGNYIGGSPRMNNGYLDFFEILRDNGYGLSEQAKNTAKSIEERVAGESKC